MVKSALRMWYLIAYHFSDLFLKIGQLRLYYGVSLRGVSI